MYHTLHNSNKLKNIDDRVFVWVVSSTVFYEPLKNTVKCFGNYIAEGLGTALMLLTMVAYIAIVFFLLVTNIKISADVIIVFAFLLISWGVSFFNHLSYFLIFFEDAVRLFVFAFPFFCISKQIHNYLYLKNCIYKSSYSAVIIMALKAVVEAINHDLLRANMAYDQTSGIVLAPACVICLVAYYEKKSLMDLFMFFLSFCLIVLFGARMPIACVLIAFVLVALERILFTPNERNIVSIGRLLVHSSLIVMAVGIIVFGWMLDDRYKEESISRFRIINLIESGEFASDDGRNTIWEAAREYISDHVINGTGVVADRLIIAKNKDVRARYGDRVDLEYKWKGFYAHNIFLELMMQHGILGGLVICMSIVALTISLLVNGDRNLRKVAIIAVANAYGIVLFSGPALDSKWLWVVIGLGSVSVINIRLNNTGKKPV